LKLKEKQNEEATHIEDTQRLVTEIEMLKAALGNKAKTKGRRNNAH
jgi:hypothetical protein